jgi:hypothetical protein
MGLVTSPDPKPPIKENSKIKRIGSVFSDTERIDKLINVEYSFVKCYGKENIEMKYA